MKGGDIIEKLKYVQEQLKDIIYRSLIGQYEKGDILYEIQKLIKFIEEE